MNTTKEIFEEFYTKNLWGCPESKSGPGSQKSQTAFHKYQFNILFQLLHIETVCGDCNWIFDCLPDYIYYTGADISETCIKDNNKKFPNRKFFVCNIIDDILPTYDLILCRDCLGHLPIEDIHKCINNFKKSKSTYLLTTTFIYTYISANTNISTGNWMPINLQGIPFNFPKPIALLDESIDMKKLGLWRINDL